ncbi:hypothetical protein F5Y16DRAFT_369222 [Xylariaceae sp. FL0255]|nr:hypothetical protein F5Y16DRAFT_369222 [Xylariaceae sp. FL0255]
MAFSVGNVSQGPALSEVQTEGLGFLSLAGDAKLRLSTPWSPPPVANASLLSIASKRGLVAAAGPDAVVLASTDTVRKAFGSPKDSDSEIRAFNPQAKIPLPFRISQLAFSADESHLILSAEQAGGLAVYNVEALNQGSTDSTFQIPTNSEPLRALVPNPRPERAELCAVVTTEGKLLMADLTKQNFIAGSAGQILKNSVSCVAWSNKGKQLVVGLGDGTMLQMTPEGVAKDEIPRPPSLDASHYVSTVVWLENDLFLVFHVSTSNGPQTKCHLITRKDKSFQFSPLNDPVDPFNSDKIPHHTAVRLKDFPPNLQDLLVFSSTAVPDIGVLARSSAPLSPNAPSGVFVNVELADDSRRAILPMGEDLDTPAAIGASLDLSSKDKVYKPIPADELDQSPGPLPGYWVLNNQGILSVWWIVYSESIRGQTTYPGLASADSSESAAKPASQPPQAHPFGSAPAATAAPAFGGPSALGAKSSPWGATPASTGTSAFGSATFGSNGAAAPSKPVFGQSSFGSGSGTAPAFGQSSGLGARASPWATATTSSSTPSFGQSGFANADMNSGTFSSTPSNNTSNPFASVTSGGGFASLASQGNENKTSIFASSNSGFPATSNETSSFFANAKPSIENPFGSQPFKLTSSFKPAAADENASDGNTAGSTEKSLFGSGFTTSLKEATKPATNLFGTALSNQAPPTSNVESTTPTTTPASNKFFSAIPPATSSSKSPFAFPSLSSNNLFGKPTPTPNESAKAPEDQPLPPDTTSKATYPLGESSSSSATTDSIPSRAEDTPLPSDLPLPAASDAASSTEMAVPTASEAPLPPDPVKNKAIYSAPLPSLPGATAKVKDAGDAPLPPDPVKNKKAYQSELPPLPGSVSQTKATSKTMSDVPLPPDPVKQPKVYETKLPALPIAKPSSANVGPGFKFPTTMPPVSDSGEDEGNDSVDENEDEEAASEGSGVDVAKDLSPASIKANKTPGFTPQSSFDGLGSSFSTLSRPDQDRRSLFGELGRNAPVLSHPNPVSPRSPSPVRGAVPTRMMGGDQTRSFSAPGMASQLLGASKKSQSTRLGGSIVGRDSAIENAVLEQQRKAKAKKEAEEAQLLIDEEDEAVQQLLRTDIEPALDLDEFIAHSGVVPPAGDSVPAQVEAVYRDINSMIDTLGLNARSLKAFTKGHIQFASDQHTKQDLASSDAWTLNDIRFLTLLIEQDLGEALDEARMVDTEEKVAQIQVLARELNRDFSRQSDLRKTLASRLDSEQASVNQSLPLSSEQAAQQSDLRRQLGQFQTLLAQAEENLALLRAKMASVTRSSGKGGPVPTIEAIVRTITKMTTMVEKRSGDIDVLENQMRKLRFGSTGPAGSREGSPFATTNGKKIFSPERSFRESTPARGRHSLSGSMMSVGESAFRTPPRKKLSGFGDAEKKAVKAKQEQRAAVLAKLRSSIQKKNPGVWALDDVE